MGATSLFQVINLGYSEGHKSRVQHRSELCLEGLIEGIERDGSVKGCLEDWVGAYWVVVWVPGAPDFTRLNLKYWAEVRHAKSGWHFKRFWYGSARH